MLLGHTQGTTTGRYRILPEGDLKHRKGLIDAIADQGLTLARFYQVRRRLADSCVQFFEDDMHLAVTSK
jgi:hypothetical protein